MAIETISIKDAADVTKNVLADLIGSDYGQVIKLAWGADGVLTLVEVAAPLPVVQTGVLTVGLNAGSNLVGQVDLNSVPAAARTTDSISAAAACDAIMVNNTVLTPKFFKANVTASSTDSSLVTAVGGKSILVMTFRIHAAGTATNVTFNSKPGGAGTAISELFACGANGGRGEGFSRIGHFKTAVGEGLTVTTGTGSTCGIGGTYVEV